MLEQSIICVDRGFHRLPNTTATQRLTLANDGEPETSE